MNKRLSEKIEEIEKYLAELLDIFPETFEEYRKNNLVKAACERYFEKIMEAVTDLSFIIIATKKLEMPQDDIDSFRILLNEKIINKSSYDKLKDAKGMRNVIAHQYGSVNDEMVFNSINNELEEDVKIFLKQVKKFQ